MTKTTNLVRKILSYSRAARNSDKELQLLMMDEYGMNLSYEQREIFRQMPSTETIRRIRQKLQEKGEFVSDQNIASERKWRGMRMQQNAPTAKPETIEKIIQPRAISWLSEED